MLNFHTFTKIARLNSHFVVYNISHNRKRIPLTIVLGMFILTMTSCRYLKQQLGLGEYSIKAAIEWAKRDSLSVSDSLKRLRVDKTVVEKAYADSIKKVISNKEVFAKILTDSLMAIEENDISPGRSGTGYYIIIGSFSNHTNAQKRARQYSALGYKTSIIKATKRDGAKVELVSIRTFDDQNKASLFLKEFKKKYDQGAWIFSKKRI